MSAFERNERACSFKGCKFFGTFQPVIAVPVEGRDRPLEFCLEVWVCERHRKEPQRAFLSDEGLKYLANILASHGYGRPDYGQLKLSFETEGGLVVPHNVKPRKV